MLPAEASGFIASAETLIVPICITFVYAGARWLKTRHWVPSWLIRVLLGSTQASVYPDRAE